MAAEYFPTDGEVAAREPTWTTLVPECLDGRIAALASSDFQQVSGDNRGSRAAAAAVTVKSN